MPPTSSLAYRMGHWLLGGGTAGSQRLKALGAVAGAGRTGLRVAGRVIRHPLTRETMGSLAIPLGLGLAGYYGTRGLGVRDFGLGEDFQNNYEEYKAKSRGLEFGGMGVGGVGGWLLGKKLMTPLLGGRLGAVAGVLGALSGGAIGKSMGSKYLETSNPFYDQKAQAVRAMRGKPSWALTTPLEQIPGSYLSRKIRGVETFDPSNIPMPMSSPYTAT